MDMEIEGKNPKGHPKRIWRQDVKDDLKLMGVKEQEGGGHRVFQSQIGLREIHPAPVKAEAVVELRSFPLQ